MILKVMSKDKNVFVHKCFIVSNECNIAISKIIVNFFYCQSLGWSKVEMYNYAECKFCQLFGESKENVHLPEKHMKTGFSDIVKNVKQLNIII